MAGMQEGRRYGRKVGRQEGRLVGRQEGRLEGRQEGRQEGADERNNEIVTNMLKKKCSLAMIEDFIQISQKQIIQIAKANNIPLP